MNATNRRLLIALGTLVVAAGVGYAWWRSTNVVPEPVQGALPPAASREEAPAAPEHPVPEAAADAPPPPPLAESDAWFASGIAALLGAAELPDFVYSERIARRFVVTVDSLAREQVPVELRPVRPVAGAFKTEGVEESPRIAAANAERYAPYVAALESLDTARAVELYRRAYPRLQEAYEGLGYPGKYFNDRVIAVIDDLLATPDLQGAPALVRPNVMYRYADAALEQRSAGQRTLLRMGPGNAARVKAKLREIRAALAQPPADATAAAGQSPT